MSRLALFLIDIPDHDLLVPATTEIGTVTGLLSWQAVDGQGNLIATVEGSAGPLMEYLNKKAGHVSVTMCEVLSTAGNSLPAISPDLCQAWVFMDTDSSLREALAVALAEIEGISPIWTVRGGCDLVALVSGRTLDEIDQIISRRIQPLDGLLRLKRNRIINLTSL